MQLTFRNLAAVVFLLSALWGKLVFAQGGSPRAYGGTEDIFKFGVGARAQGLGSAVVAMPQDATTLYWNPGGLDRLERRSVVLFYSPLIAAADVKYYFVGAAYPILNFGTIGAGLLHYDVGDIPQADQDGVQGEKLTYGEDLFLLSYAKQMPYGLSLGGNVKVQLEKDYYGGSTRGFGADLGLLYSPEFDGGIFENLSFGLSVFNAIRPNLVDAKPQIIRAGMAKAIPFGSRGDRANLFLALEKPESSTGIKTRFNLGTEYIYQNLGMLRAGYNGETMQFGGGVLYQNKFQIDYAFGRYGKDSWIDPIHRLSLTVHLGRTKTQMREDEQARVLQRIEDETQKQVRLKRQSEFEDAITAGKNYFEQKDYFNAYLKFTGGRDLAASSNNIFSGPEKDDVNVWVERAQSKLNEETAAKNAEIRQQVEKDVVASRERAFIEEQIQKGMQYLQTGKLNEAVAEWKRGLERDPNNLQIKELIAKTEGEKRNRQGDLLRRARSFESSGQVGDAINAYAQLMNQPDISPAELKSHQDRIAQLQRQLKYDDLFRQGYTEYLNKNYCAARSFFTQALQVEPNNATLKKNYYDAEVRCSARLGPIPESIKPRFTEAMGLMQNEDYESALRILEEIQKQDRYNKRILDAIDEARKNVKTNSKK